MFAAHAFTSLGSTATVLSTDILVKTVSLTTSGIFTIGKSLFTTSGYIDLLVLQELEKKIDLIETVKLYDLWIKELLEKQHSRIEKSNTLQEAIKGFIAVLDELHEILKNIDNKVNEHRQKWFYTWRSLNFNAEMEEIKTKKTILDNRFNMLQKLNLSF